MQSAKAAELEGLSRLPGPGLCHVWIGGEYRPGNEILRRNAKAVAGQARDLRAIGHPQVRGIGTPRQQPFVPWLEKGIVLPTDDRNVQIMAGKLTQEGGAGQGRPDYVGLRPTCLRDHPAKGGKVIPFRALSHHRFDPIGLQALDRFSISSRQGEKLHSRPGTFKCFDYARQGSLCTASLHRVDEVGNFHHLPSLRLVIASAMARAPRLDGGVLPNAKVSAISVRCTSR